MSNGDPDDPLSRMIRSAGRRDDVPADARTRVKDAARAQWQATVRRRRYKKWALWSGSVAAAVLVAALFVPAVFFRDKPPVATVALVDGSLSVDGVALKAGASVPIGATIATGANDRGSLQMANGQSLRLDRGTKITIASAELVMLDGGAVYIDTQAGGHQPGRSLEVRSALGSVRDEGTQFEVRTLSEGLRVRVREGRIFYEQGSDKATASAGEQLQASGKGAPTRSNVSVDHADWQWTSACAPAFELEGAMLPEFLQWACREQGLRLEYATDETRSACSAIRLHGTVQGMSPAVALESVLPTCSVSFRVHAGALVINLER